MTVAAPTPRPTLSTTLASAILVASIATVALSDHGASRHALLYLLIVVATGAALFVSGVGSNSTFSPAFICGMMAVAFLGPPAAFLVPLVAETATWIIERYRWRAFVNNLAAIPGATLVIALAFEAIDPARGSWQFYTVLAVATLVEFLVNVVVIVYLMSLLDGGDMRTGLKSYVAFLPTVVFSVALVLAVSAAYIDFGLVAIAYLAVALAGVGYMTHLVSLARQQAREFANLSWGILSSLLRTLNERDVRASRHCAAVAKFSRDIARAAALGERDQELAHTAGLMHDIGRFVLSDRVMERGAELTPDDWRGIRRHPDVGADLLQNIGVYGPVGEIVRCHHERIDGRGYPRGLTGEDIPEVAKIVAIAEIYDTLTAPDTYRKPMSSFEALTELRRVSGRQVAGEYVDIFSDLMYGKGVEYRHSESADFDVELAVEERIRDAATTT